MRAFYQDRLGTDIRKTPKQDRFPSDTASHVDFYFASGLFSQGLYAEIQAECAGDRSALDFPSEKLKVRNGPRVFGSLFEQNNNQLD
jgi:hypothetical protein|eukprot:COSAG06_NODE_2600_length_6600_cov_1.974004_2_plen_87_part_00